MTQFLQPRMVLAPVIMLYVRMWDLEDEEVLFNIRCFYGASQTLLFGTLMYIRYASETTRAVPSALLSVVQLIV